MAVGEPHLADEETMPVQTLKSHTKTVLPRIAFLMEQQAGLGSHYANWRGAEQTLAEIARPAWYPITYYDPEGLIERLTFLPHAVRALWRSYRQVSDALHTEVNAGTFAALLFNTHNPAVLHLRAVRTHPAFLQFDVTPALLDSMNDYTHVNNSLGPRRLAGWKSNRVQEVYQQAAGLMPWSAWAAQSARETYGIPKERIHIVPPGVDTDRWRPAESRSARSTVRLLFVGGDFTRKGGDLLLRWARETTKRAWELHCVTTEPQQTVPPNVVIHNGLRANTPELIALTQSCDLLVLPTRADCFSLAALEAMACGLPVLISRVGGIPDIVQEGETGHLVPPNDYDALAHTLDTLLDDPGRREEMGRRAREVVCARFAARHTLRQAVDIMLASA